MCPFTEFREQMKHNDIGIYQSRKSYKTIFKVSETPGNNSESR